MIARRLDKVLLLLTVVDCGTITDAQWIADLVQAIMDCPLDDQDVDDDSGAPQLYFPIYR